MKKSQTKMILSRLRRRGSVTALDAFRMGCLRLAARISDLRAEGYRIVSERETKRGKTYSRYRLA